MNTNTVQARPMLTVVSRGVMDALSPDELQAAVSQIKQKMKVPDPDNPNLWTTQIGPHTLWGVLDEGAGTHGEDVFTVLFPSDY